MNTHEPEDVYEEIRNDPAFAHLRVGKNRLVPGEGNSRNPVAFVIGEAPGAQEAMQLRPFVGASGKIQRDLMRLATLSTDEPEANCWLTNVVKYRPPSNRTPNPEEVNASRKYVFREWQAVRHPGVVVTVGAVALRALMGKQHSILDNAGTVMYSANGTEIWPMIHPAFALRNTEYRSILENHWLHLGQTLRSRGLL